VPVRDVAPDALPGLLADAGVRRGQPLGLVLGTDGLGLGTGEAGWAVRTSDPAGVLAAVAAAVAPRWTWWRASDLAPLPAAGVRLRGCWDVAAVTRLLHGGRRDDPGAAWALAHGMPLPAAPEPDLVLLAAVERGTGQLDPELGRDPDAERAAAWAAYAVQVQRQQEAALLALPDTRPAHPEPALAVLTAFSESAAALLAVELAQEGLPLDRAVTERLVGSYVGPRGTRNEARDAEVLRHFRAPCDLRNPIQVRAMLLTAGIDVPDTRSWRLEPFRSTVPGVAALLDWRKAERIATTYGYGWLDRHVGADGRLRGAWAASDGAAGRMTALAGLHNMPAALRSAVAAEPGYLLVRADLGQVEPRVLAVVSGDPALAAAARADDMYAPVAEQLGCDRPTAKVAVLSAMYGQTSGAAGAALRRMERTYPTALALLGAAEERGQVGLDVRTYGGRLVRMGGPADPDRGRGRYARNAVVQGAAAELFKAWAATVRGGLGPLGGRIVLCLHDELLVHVPAAQAPAAAELLATALQSTAARWAAGSGVRFVAEVATGRTWAEAKGP